MKDEMIESLIGQRVELTYLSHVGEGNWGDGYAEYASGVRYAPGVKLVSASDVGIVVESTGFAGDGERFFIAWGAVIVVSPVKEQSE